MRLFEAIIDANHQAVAGDASAGLHPADFADNLPVIALTCVDPRLNAFFPNALALPGEQFIWLRNAGNIITGPMSSTMRSLALACAVKGGEEIAIIGHTDCQIAKTTTGVLLEKLSALGATVCRIISASFSARSAANVRTSSGPAISCGTARSSARRFRSTA